MYLFLLLITFFSSDYFCIYGIGFLNTVWSMANKATPANLNFFLVKYLEENKIVLNTWDTGNHAVPKEKI